MLSIARKQSRALALAPVAAMHRTVTRPGRLAASLLAALLAAAVLPAVAQSTSRTDTITYEDNFGAWVIGQPKKSTNVDTGLVENETVYDAATALPIRTYNFGKLQQTLTYHADGTLATESDGRDTPTFNTTVSFSNWKRGLPQRIEFPTGHYRSMWVDNYGLIRSVREENGYLTCYAFDAMGRLARIEYPSETQNSVCDASAWNNLVRSFQQTNVAEFGLTAGHWREFVQTGRGVKATYYDAMWRPVLTRTYDLDDRNALSQTVTRYDANGQPVFQSYPTRALINDFKQALPGTRTTYDALGRTTRVEQDAESDLGGLVVSTTEYLSGFKTKTTNPRGKATTTEYLTYDEPTTEMPILIAHPSGVFTDIARDKFGKPTILARSDASVSAVRTYAYNAAQELCRVVEPETGATLSGYDAAGNLAWSAAGLRFDTACNANGNTAEILARKVTRDYDQRNRITQLTFADNRGNTSYTYYPDGQQNVLTVNNGDGNTVSTNYQYNRRRLLTSEQLTWSAIAWAVTYGYNNNGHLANQGYPAGLTIDYAPNALGQATKAGTYATGVTYHPNGAIAGFTYGNGIVHSLTQNARQLPLRSRDADADNAAIPL
ncbi:MAG: RHS repeat protein, partial [Lysobacter sp.]|nr:RHS repeat protein [Lysobacter sp.]